MSGGHWNVTRSVDEYQMFEHLEDYRDMANTLRGRLGADDVADHIESVCDDMYDAMDRAGGRVWQYGSGDLWPVIEVLDRCACGDDTDEDVHEKIKEWRENHDLNRKVVIKMREQFLDKLYYDVGDGKLMPLFADGCSQTIVGAALCEMLVTTTLEAR